MIRSIDIAASPVRAPRADEAWQHLVQRVLALRDDGHSIRAIVDHLADDDVLTSRSTVHRIIANNPRQPRESGDASTVRIAVARRRIRKPRSSPLDAHGPCIAALYAAGASPAFIGAWLLRTHGISRSAAAVDRWIRRNQEATYRVPPGFDARRIIQHVPIERPRTWRPNAISAANLDSWVHELRAAGYAYAEIARLCRAEAGVDITASAVRKWMAAHPRGPRVVPDTPKNGT